MIFLKKFLFQLRLNFSSSDKIERKPVSFEKANHIGMLISSTSLKDAGSVNEFASRLIKEGKKVTAICFISGKKSFHFDFPCFYFSWEDIDWKGRFKREIIHSFIKTPFDYLYSINIFPILLFKYILNKSKAGCRVGLFEENAPLDLMIMIPEDQDLSFLIGHMINYSQKIKTEE
jgi:hypothetical protein